LYELLVRVFLLELLAGNDATRSALFWDSSLHDPSFRAAHPIFEAELTQTPYLLRHADGIQAFRISWFIRSIDTFRAQNQSPPFL